MFDETTQYIQNIYPHSIDIAIILGSGLGNLTQILEHPVIIDYHDIPHFPVSTTEGHDGKLYIGRYQNKHVLMMKGRFHYFEDYEMNQITYPIRIFKKLQIPKLILTNACGGISDSLNPGQIMLIKDHLSVFMPSVLRGPNLEEFGPRFKDMTEVYNKNLRQQCLKIAHSLDISLIEGIYGYFTGPRFETPADIQAYKVLGADAVGMSTVPEAIVARHCDIETIGLSLVTNKAAGLSQNEITHEEVQIEAHKAQEKFILLMKEIIKNIA